MFLQLQYPNYNLHSSHYTPKYVSVDYIYDNVRKL
jgi:hypothetical protein